MTEGRGVLLGWLGTPGQAHESKSFEALMDTVEISRRRRLEAVAGDKAYTCSGIGVSLGRRSIEAVIPARQSVGA